MLAAGGMSDAPATSLLSRQQAGLGIEWLSLL